MLTLQDWIGIIGATAVAVVALIAGLAVRRSRRVAREDQHRLLQRAREWQQSMKR